LVLAENQSLQSPAPRNHTTGDPFQVVTPQNNNPQHQRVRHPGPQSKTMGAQNPI